nr:10 kDa chaperonin, mitochondrial-like [Tanacetum cinerariifolium]
MHPRPKSALTAREKTLVESWSRRLPPPSKTTAGILLPEKASKLNSGRVVAVGPGIRDSSGKTVPVAVKEGDTVLLPEYGGQEVKLGDKEYHLFRDEDILGTLHE